VALVADAIRDRPRRGEIVLDPFGGSGTTLMAAEKTGRQARLVEFDPAYCDQTLHRFEQVTGKPARLAATGRASRTSPKQAGRNPTSSRACYEPPRETGGGIFADTGRF